MSQAFGYLIFAFLLIIAAVGVVVAALAVRDCLDRGDRRAFDAIDQWEAARDVTGRVSR